MKCRTWINEALEVEVSVDAFVEALLDLPEPSREATAVAAINNCYSVLKRIPNRVIEEMTEAQRYMIGISLREQGARYLDPSATKEDGARKV